MKEYKIITELSTGESETAINTAARNGFELVGPVQFYSDEADYYYVATMARKVSKPNNADDLRDPAQAQA